MDRRSIKFDWNRARAFLVTAEEGSLSAAARALGMTQPTLSRQVAALEQELGMVLFERVGQGLLLTPSGLALMEHVQAMGAAANDLSLAAKGHSVNIEGNICISASEVQASYILPPIIAKLRKLEPKITVEIIATNEPSNLNKREADIAIRHFRPTQGDLIAKKIKDVSAKLYATPEYLASINNPTAIGDLQQAEFVSFDDSNMLFNGLNEFGLNLTKQQFPVLSTHFIAHWEMVKQGIGIGVMQTDVGDKEPLVKAVLPDLVTIPFPIWLVTHRELNTSRRVRMVFDLLAEELAK